MQTIHSVPFQTSDRLALFPDSTRIQNDSLFIAGHDLASLADRYGTPLYIYDRATLDASVAEYQAALRKQYPAASSITYAGKAFLCKALAEWTQTHGLFVDCTGEGEIAVAVAGGVPRENILVHGVNKSTSDLQAALEHAGTIVVDNLTELTQIHVILSAAKNLYHNVRDSSVVARPAPLSQSDMNIWLRLLPGVAVHTHHAHTQTGQHDSKFGMTRAEILQAARFCREHDLPLKGIHFHQGSNFRDPEPLIPAIDMALDLAREIGFNGEWHFCPGGGWGVAYHEDELPNPPLKLVRDCRVGSRRLPGGRLGSAPASSRAKHSRTPGCPLSRRAVKKREDKTWLLTDGGMADNPRFAPMRRDIRVCCH
jgi:diaminopimelate decarboxylase